MIHLSGFDLSRNTGTVGAAPNAPAAQPSHARGGDGIDGMMRNLIKPSVIQCDPSARILFFVVFCLLFSSHGGRFVFFWILDERKIHLRWRTVAVMACAKRWILAAVVGWPNLGWVLWYLTDLYSNLGKDRKVDDDYILVGIYQILSFWLVLWYFCCHN